MDRVHALTDRSRGLSKEGEASEESPGENGLDWGVQFSSVSQSDSL